MAHPALVANERPDGLNNCHYAHWGALDLGLIDELTPKTPLGGYDDSGWAREFYAALADDIPNTQPQGRLTEAETRADDM